MGFKFAGTSQGNSAENYSAAVTDGDIDGPSRLRRTVISSLGGFFCISSLKNFRVHLWTDFMQIRRNLNKNQLKKGFWTHIKLKEKALKIP